MFNTMTGIIFPIVTFPYAARILMPEGIGIVNFQLSIITNIVLLTSLGIPMYAVREVARHRDDIALRNKTTVEILLLSVILCLMGYVLVWALGAFVPQINQNLGIFYVLSLSIVFTAIGVNWFYQAIEDFMFMTVRTTIFRFWVVFGLFLFVKTPDDLLIYALVIVGTTVGNNIINFIHLRKFIPLKSIPWRELRVWRHLKPSLHIFVFNLITSIYLNLNVMMLGFMKGDAAVGYYTAGNRLSQIVLSVVASISTVMLPRCANLFETGRMDEFAAICRKTLRLTVALSLPCMIGLLSVSEGIVAIFCGPDFTPAVSVLCWTAPIILFISLTNMFGLQVLYPQGKENIVIWSVAGGALFNFLINFALIPLLAQDGAAIATFAAELVVLIIQITWGRRFIPFPIIERVHLHYVAAGVLMSIALWAVGGCMPNVWMQLLLSIATGSIVYVGALAFMHDALLREMGQYALGLVKRKKKP